MSDRFVQAGAFFQLRFIHRAFGQQSGGGLAATGAQGIQIIGGPRRAANRKCGMLFSRSHGPKMTHLHRAATEKESLSEIGVCLTNNYGAANSGSLPVC